MATTFTGVLPYLKIDFYHLKYYRYVTTQMNYRKQRGINITKKKHQMYRMDESTYQVCSQTTPDVQYTLCRTTAGWDCNCPDNTQYCKHAYALEERLGMKARADRGMMIHQAAGQVERIASDHYLVKSQSKDESYEVRDFGNGWICSCPDHMHTGSTCKHIQAVQWHNGERRIIQPHNHTRCKFCDSIHIIKKGVRGKKQQYGCKTCGKRFIQNLGFERKRATPDDVCAAVGMYFAGLSSRKVANHLKQKGLKITYRTIQNWGSTYAELMESYIDTVHPRLSEAWRTDELHMKVKGRKRYLFAMLDSGTRYWISKMVAEHKGNDDVAPMFAHAKEIAGKVPDTLISDGAANFHNAWEKQYKSKNFLHKETQHVNDVAFDGIHHNNQMESFNGNTLRYREEAARGLKREDSPIVSGLKIYHNCVRPHLGLADGQTPAEAAGIIIDGTNKWKTLIEVATKAQRE